jgi:hypothetical protein
MDDMCRIAPVCTSATLSLLHASGARMTDEDAIDTSRCCLTTSLSCHRIFQEE